MAQPKKDEVPKVFRNGTQDAVDRQLEELREKRKRNQELHDEPDARA